MHRLVPKAGNLSVCSTCHADDVTREEAAEAARLQAVTPPEAENDHDRESVKLRRGLFRRRG